VKELYLTILIKFDIIKLPKEKEKKEMLGGGIILLIMGIIFLNESFNHWREYESTFFAGCVCGCGFGSIFIALMLFSQI
jgi:hypothetical protein